MHRDAIYCCWGKQDAKSPFSGMHGVRNVQETSSLRPLEKTRTVLVFLCRAPITLGVPAGVGGTWSRYFPIFIRFPCAGDSFELTVVWGHNSVTMRYENIRDVAFQTYPSRSYSGAKVTSHHSSEMFRRWSFLSFAFFPGSPCQLLSRALQRPQNNEFSQQILETSGNFWNLEHRVPEHTWTILNHSLLENAIDIQCTAVPVQDTVRLPLQTCWHGKMYKTCKGYLWKSQCTKRLTPSSTIPIFFDSWWWEPLLENACLEHLVTATMNDFKHVQKFITPQLCSKIRL